MNKYNIIGVLDFDVVVSLIFGILNADELGRKLNPVHFSVS